MRPRDEREAAMALDGGVITAPANPYPSPEARLEDRPGYPFAVPARLRPSPYDVKPEQTRP